MLRDLLNSLVNLRVILGGQSGIALNSGLDDTTESSIPVLATKSMITCCLERFHTIVFFHLHQSNIECTASQVIDQHTGVFSPVIGSVVHSSCGRLVNDLPDVQACGPGGTHGRATLLVIEIRGNRDNGLVDFLMGDRLGLLLQKTEQDCGKVLCGISLSIERAVRLRLSHAPLKSRDTAGFARLVGILCFGANNDISVL